MLKTQLRLYDWVHHYEKMLYDNAQLARVYLHAYQVTNDPFFKRIITETLDFIAREMAHPDGGFHSSLDADSESVEGKFYVWTLEEIRKTLKDDSEFFEAAYGVTPRGNWEERTVLQRALDDASLAARFKLDPETVPAKLADCHSRLLTVRSARIRPGTDNKVLTSWNGLMLATLAEAARVLESGSLLPSSDQQAGQFHKMATCEPTVHRLHSTASASLPFLAVMCDMLTSRMDFFLSFTSAIVAVCDNRPRFSNGGNYGQRTCKPPTSG